MSILFTLQMLHREKPPPVPHDDVPSLIVREAQEPWSPIGPGFWWFLVTSTILTCDCHIFVATEYLDRWFIIRQPAIVSFLLDL